MLTSVFRILTAATVMGIALSPGAASAGVLRPTTLAYSSSWTQAAELRPRHRYRPGQLHPHHRRGPVR
jgi:hypothetical protein